MALVKCGECRFFSHENLCCERDYGAVAILKETRECDHFEAGAYDPSNLESTKKLELKSKGGQA